MNVGRQHEWVSEDPVHGCLGLRLAPAGQLLRGVILMLPVHREVSVEIHSVAVRPTRRPEAMNGMGYGKKRRCTAARLRRSNVVINRAEHCIAARAYS